MSKEKRYARKKKVAERYNSSTRSVDRWCNDPKLSFPQPIEINGQKLWDLDELDVFDRAHAVAYARKVA